MEIFEFSPNADLYSSDIVSTSSWHVECVVILRGVKTNSHINIDFDVSKLGIRDSTATYGDIKDYVSKKYRYKVSSLYIAQVKGKLVIKERENYNIGEGKSIVLYRPPEKKEVIKDALRHFGVV